MGIILIDEEPSQKFQEGNIVFIFFEDGKIKGMVNTKEDYDKKLETHLFLPILFVIPLHIRIAYLFDGLHREYSPEASTYPTKKIMVKWRYIGENGWKVWFEINPYGDSYYF
jgi:hypothetical protein